MTTKPKVADATPALETPTVAATEAPAVAKKPFSISVAAPCHIAFAESVIHARNGYTFSDGPIEVQPNGWAFFTMVAGSPNEFAIQNAKASAEMSLQEEERKYRKDIEAAAKRLLEQQQRDDFEKKKAAIKAEHEKALRALEAATEAAIAKL